MNKELITQLPRVEQLFDQYAERFGKQQTAYRNHVYRLVNLVMAQRPVNDEELGKLQVAAFFHDAGIWLAGTFDYLQPSARLAEHYLQEEGLEDWSQDVRTMIMNHHKPLDQTGLPQCGLSSATAEAERPATAQPALAPLAHAQTIKQPPPEP